MRSRQSTQIYRRRVDRVIDHIKDHLTEPMPIATLARVAHFSPFHFHRVFRAIVGEPVHAFIVRLGLELAVFQILHGPKATLTAIGLSSGFASSSDFSRAFKQTYGFSPRGFSRSRLLEESKIRQDLMINNWYGFGKLPDGRNPDRFRVRVVDWPAQRIAYERVIGAFDWCRLKAGFYRLMSWAKQCGLAKAQLIGRPLDDLDITPMEKFRLDWCVILPSGFEPTGDVSVGEILANRFATVRCAGDLHKADRALKYLFHAWLPGSGYQPADASTLEVYRRSPAELGWETFDIDCYIPVRPLRSR